MAISVLNKKGGVGKTPFAFSIAKDLGMFLQSNDNSIIENIYKDYAKISKKPEFLENCVFDFGGFVEKGVLDIVKKSKFVIVPCTSSYNSILRTIETINEIRELNQNVLVLVTDYHNEKEKETITDALNGNLCDLEYFFFKASRIVENAMSSGVSFTELYNENGLSKICYLNFFNEYQRLLQRIQQ